MPDFNAGPNRLGGPPGSKDREITIKIKDPSSINILKSMTASRIRDNINEAINIAPSFKNTPIRIAAARQLKSGNITIHAEQSKDIDLLVKHSFAWVRVLGHEAQVAILTFGVLIHNVRTNQVDTKDQAKLIQQVMMENMSMLGEAEITYIGWLTRAGTKKQASSLVIEFTRPEDANKAIEEGLIMDAEIHNCELSDRGCKLKQCFRCQKYGHIGT